MLLSTVISQSLLRGRICAAGPTWFRQAAPRSAPPSAECSWYRAECLLSLSTNVMSFVKFCSRLNTLRAPRAGRGHCRRRLLGQLFYKIRLMITNTNYVRVKSSDKLKIETLVKPLKMTKIWRDKIDLGQIDIAEFRFYGPESKFQRNLEKRFWNFRRHFQKFDQCFEDFWICKTTCNGLHLKNWHGTSCNILKL